MANSPTLILQNIGVNGTQVSYPLIINPNVMAYNTYIENQRAFYERMIGGSGWTEDQIANSAVRSQNIALQSDRITTRNSNFDFATTNGVFYNLLNEGNINASIPITLSQPNQIVRFHLETGAIWLKGSAGGNLMKVKLERSTSPIFTTVTVINNSGNTENTNRGWRVIDSFMLYLEDDTIKPANTTYYYRFLIDYNHTGITSHWNWQGWTIYDVYNARSTY